MCPEQTNSLHEKDLIKKEISKIEIANQINDQEAHKTGVIQMKMID